jgi:predicted phage baseplate assembly protein
MKLPLSCHKNDCDDCCTGVEVITPEVTANRAGLSTLTYRAGTYATFFETMQARLSSASYPALAALRTREKSDASIALLDAWSAVGDVLTFYQERIANEGYLRTASERRSILEQARLVGYRLRPGVAASVYLAYTIEKDSPPVTIAKGARANSIPAPGEKMQAFETAEDLKARFEWNAIKPRSIRPQTAQSILADGLYLKGTATNLKTNDALLIDFAIAGGSPLPFRIKEVNADAKNDRTLVKLLSWTGGLPFVDAIKTLAGEFSDFGRFEVSANSATAKRVKEVMSQVSEAVVENVPSRLALHLQVETLPALANELKIARERNFVKIVAWLESMMAAFADAQALAPQIEQAVPLHRSASAASIGLRDGQSLLSTVVAELQVPGSIPPASTRQLGRSIQNTFAPNSDIAPTLLSSLVPRLSGTLYRALASVAVTAASQIKVYAIRKTAPLFGHNAPKEPQYNNNGTPKPQIDWPDWNVAQDERSNAAFLDSAYEQILINSTAIIQRPDPADATKTSVIVTKVLQSTTASRNTYGLSGKTTRLTFADDWWQPNGDIEAGGRDFFDTLRATTVFCQSEELPLAEAPITDEVCDDFVELDRLYDGLESGRWMIISGERTDIPRTTGVRASELVMLAGVTNATQTISRRDESGAVSEIPLNGDTLHTRITFAKPLAYCYKRETVLIYGNVAKATHGETRQEVLGSGNAAQSMQTFRLKQSPLTFTSAASISGTESTLEVRVNDVLWHEAPNLLDLDSRDRGFISDIDDDGQTAIIFGTGQLGARLPTGVENIRATYRSGIGKPGNVKAEQISLLATKPLGVKEVINPIRASGGADREGRDQARKNAPLAVMALDRLVSTQDYADFARTFAGVGKASAVRISDGLRELVHVTIAGADDIPIDKTSDLYRNLTEALQRYGDPYLPVQIDVREVLALVIAANVKVLPDYQWETVEPRIRVALLDHFGFEKQELGEDVSPSAVIATIQNVRGVDYVDLDALEALGEAKLIARLEPPTGNVIVDGMPDRTPVNARLPRRVVVQAARMIGRTIQPAQLAYLQANVPDTLILNEVKA